jgi:DnaJ-class molecular chaperone
MTDNYLVTCPVCEGTKISPLGAKNSPCKCCHGCGHITKTHKKALDQIKAELKIKLAEARHN